ncbi:MAG: glutamate-5-semialdehyde dehydrogenase [Chloroflexi bacterium]|jgi:glutamate-5-semialdehyde dehydrogenase|nr:glutamate-5-semialdehyde dehydrogenase [Chloroflexota bacterium]
MTNVDLQAMGRRAKEAGRQLGLLSAEARAAALEAIARALETAGDALQAANEADVQEARAAQIAPSLIDRLTLTPKRIQGMAQGCRDVANLPDPVGEIFDAKTLPNGLRIAKKRVPLGVLAVIFESRPNVTIDISALAIKTGNAVIMRGGKETLRSNIALVELVRRACEEQGLPADVVQLITSTDRALVPELLGMDDVIDLVIPRGGTGLQNLVKEHAKMPVAFGGIGVCHLFADATADVPKSIAVIRNAKIQAPSVCNALDTVLVHRDIVDALVPAMVADLNSHGVEVRCDEASLRALEGAEGINRELVTAAQPEDYGKEFLALVLSVRVVDSLDEAIAHIARYSTNHSDGILTSNYANAMRFLDEVDSAAVYVNASTRFTDGGQFGLGAEVAISTQRMHARGPMGPKELTTYKWIIQGDWHVRP